MASWINHGFTLDGGSGASDRSDANAILIDPLFKGAKSNNKDDAVKLWQREWDKNAEQNKQRLLDATADCDNIVFISVPGTSRKNRIPLTAASHLSRILGEKARFINGDLAFLPLHTSMMKSIPRGERVFHPRVFEAHHSVFKAIHETCPKARFFVVEDLLTTGNSAHSFQRFLEKNGLSVYGVIAMKGEYQPNVPDNLTKKLDKFFKKNNIDIDASKLAQELTEKEAQTIAFQITAQFKNADDEHKMLFKKLFQTLYDIRVNNNHHALPEIDRLGLLLTNYLNQTKEVSHEQSHTQTNSDTILLPQVSVSKILEKHSERSADKPVTGRTTQNGPTAPTGRLRDNRENEGSTRNNFFSKITGLEENKIRQLPYRKENDRS